MSLLSVVYKLDTKAYYDLHGGYFVLGVPVLLDFGIC